VSSSASGLTKIPTAGSLSIDEIQAQVTEHVQNALAAGKKPALPLPPQLLLMRTSRASLDPTGGLSYATPGNSAISGPFSTIEVRMVPENVTLVPKSGRGQANPQVSQMEERLVVVRHGDALEDILPGTHISAVGADSPGKQELDARILKTSALLLADSRAQCEKLGELQHAMSERGRAVEIGSFCAAPVAFDRAGITVADFTGLGAEDLFIAETCLEGLAR